MSDHFTTEDIAAVGRYMKAFYPSSPEKAEPAYCLAFLEHIRSSIDENLRTIALDSPDKFEELVDEYEKSLNS
jgi:hypothetical protein